MGQVSATDRPTNGPTDRPTDRWTDRPTRASERASKRPTERVLVLMCSYWSGSALCHSCTVRHHHFQRPPHRSARAPSAHGIYTLHGLHSCLCVCLHTRLRMCLNIISTMTHDYPCDYSCVSVTCPVWLHLNSTVAEDVIMSEPWLVVRPNHS